MAGWTHEEAKRRPIVDRLYERCRTYDPSGQECYMRLDKPDWCERCLAVDEINYLRGLVLEYEGAIDA